LGGWGGVGGCDVHATILNLSFQVNEPTK